MNRQTRLGCGRGQHARAFTLIELMVVISIIALLIGLLVPAVGAVRKIARETSTKAVLSALEVGLEAYKADAKLGGAYPPSFSDADGKGVPLGMVKNPSKNLGSPSAPDSISITGAGLLVWALSGADLLGTPGFQLLGTATWADAGGSEPSRPQVSAYALDANGQPAHARSGPYVDMSKVKVTANAAGAGAAPDFVIPAEKKAREALGKPPVRRNYPVYLDTFGYPIVYWRADTGARGPWDRTNWGQVPPPSTKNAPRGVYHYTDNWALVRNGAGNPGDDPGLVLSAAGNPHKLEWEQAWTGGARPNPGFFQGYICNEAVTARPWPHRDDTYLLVSPGADGLYGTADDVADFSHNGR